MGCLDTSLTWLLYLAVLGGTYYTFVYSWWVGICLTLPPLLGDVIIKRTHKRVAFVVKLMLIFQTIMLWAILPWATFQSFDTTKMSPRVVNIIKQTQEKMPSRAVLADNIRNWVPKMGLNYSFFSSLQTEQISEDVFGNLSTTNFPDLKYRSPQEVRQKLKTLFRELPKEGFDPSFVNPCWFHDRSDIFEDSARREHSPAHTKSSPNSGRQNMNEGGGSQILSCLPYVYLLGQPKSGTSDLFERLVQHPDVIAPTRKEVRWFTRGEFTKERLDYHQLLNEETSIYSFTSSFEAAADEVLRRQRAGARHAITVDGGPHTLWWPTQSPDGALMPEEIPPPQIIREMQPNAKFLITLSDPVSRMYSDYYFLDDSLKPVEMVNRQRRGQPPSKGERVKSPEEFHGRAVTQVEEFNKCIHQVETENSKIGWFRASQICAHDRKKFGIGGWGRLNIGLYVAFIEKWLEHFSLKQFHIVRLEDYHADPEAYMKSVFEFLGLPSDVDMTTILTDKVFNEHRTDRPPMRPETEKLLREFYQPYNDLLAKLLKSTSFQWLDGPDGNTKREHHIRVAPGPNAHKVVQPGVLNPIQNQQREKTRSFDSGYVLETAPVFSLDGLSVPPEGTAMNAMTRHVVDPMRRPDTKGEAAEKLCISAFALDLVALKTLLVDQHVPSDVRIVNEFDRNAFHCLCMLGLNVDAHSKSHIFKFLQGEEGYLTNIFDPPLPLHMASTVGIDILKSLESRAIEVAKWLLRAGTSVDAPDANGVSPIHFATVSGNVALVQFLLDNGANPSARTNKEGRLPCHYAAAYGHAQVLKVLIDKGCGIDEADLVGVTPRQIIEAPGPLLADEVKSILHMEQNPIRTVERPKYPSYDKPVEGMDSEEPINIGGYDPTRLKGFEDAMHCDADQYNAGEITGKEIYEKYLAQNRPILIRGLIDKWPAVQDYRRDILKRNHGNLDVDVTSIPYAEKFSGEGKVSMPLGKYMDQVANHSIHGGSHPWYVFIGHPLRTKPKRGLRGRPIPDPDQHPETDSSALHPMGRASRLVHTHLVDYETVPTPDVIHEAMQYLTQGPTSYLQSIKSERREYVNAQWAYGGAGTGAPVHYHNTAWNALVYGAKYWLMYPPHTLVMSNKQILQFVEEDLPEMSSRGLKPLTCVQTAGDVMIIPESWSHGVLNIQESIAVATEAQKYMWRHSPGSRIVLDAIPTDVRGSGPPS